MNRIFDKISKEAEKRCIDEVITRVGEIDGDSVGIIAAQDIIDIVIQNLGPEIYNQGVRDAKKIVSDHFVDIETSVDMLEQ